MTAAAAPAARPAVYPRPPSTPPQLLAALSYARRGWPVFPCKPRDKRPLIADWPHQASTDPATIRAWWQQYPQANVAIVPPPGLVVIDIDAKANGIAWLEGPGAALCPPTLTSETGGGGLHLLYSVPLDAPIRQSAGEIAPGVDVRAAGRGYIVAPPSLHPAGTLYHWRAGAGPDETEPTAAPPALLALLAPPAPTEPPPAPVPAPPADDRPNLETLLEWGLKRAASGNRNATGFKLARQCQANGYSEGDTESILRQYQQRVTTGADPYTWHEARASLRSAYRYAPLAPWDRGAYAPRPDAPPDAAEVARAVTEPPPGADGVIADVDPVALLPTILAELAALRLELHEERAARLAAEARAAAAEARAADADARARFVREWLKIPNVLPGVKMTAPFMAWQYQARVSVGDVDPDGWARLSLTALVDSQFGPLPPKEQATRAETAGNYVRDTAALGWWERKEGTPTQIAGHWVRPILIRPALPAVLTNPAALPFPTERKPRPAKATCPACQSQRTRQIIMCQCEECGHTFPKPVDVPPDPALAAPNVDDESAPGADAPPIPEKAEYIAPSVFYSGKSGIGTERDPHRVAGPTAGAPTLRVAGDVARELQARRGAPPLDDYLDVFDDPILAPSAPMPAAEYCSWCAPAPCTCDAGIFRQTITAERRSPDAG